MSPEPDRQAAYDQLREKFLADPEFRSQFVADPVGTLEREFGPLTDAERARVASLGDVSADELVDQLKGKVGAW